MTIDTEVLRMWLQHLQRPLYTILLATLLLTGLTASIFADETPVTKPVAATERTQPTALPKLTAAQLQVVRDAKVKLQFLDELKTAGRISVPDYALHKEFVFQKIVIDLGIPIASGSMNDLLESAAAIATEAENTSLLSSISGWFSLRRILAFFGCVLVGIFGSVLAIRYLLPVCACIPATVYEGLGYLACTGVMLAGFRYTGTTQSVYFLIGCILLAGAIALTHMIHEGAVDAFYTKLRARQETFIPFLLMLLWGIVAVVSQNQVVGFLTILAAEAFLGFSVVVTPLCYAVGFSERDVIPRAMASSLFLIVFAAAGKILSLNYGYAAVFLYGASWIGTFVYFIGLLIVSSKWYSKKNYVFAQLLTIASGIAALTLGSVYHIAHLQQIGGTLFFLYCIEKYIELTHELSFLWIGFGLGLFLVGSYFVSLNFPEFFFLM